MFAHDSFSRVLVHPIPALPFACKGEWLFGSEQSLFLKKVASKIEFLPLCYYIICVI